jgi:hypothetical protein
MFAKRRHPSSGRRSKMRILPIHQLSGVFTNNPNYIEFYADGLRTGTFVGTGANNPRPAKSDPTNRPAAWRITLLSFSFSTVCD